MKPFFCENYFFYKKNYNLLRISSKIGTMKNILTTLIVLFTLISVVKADHYAGAELNYTCLGPNGANFDYEITLTVYRDCSGEILDEFYLVDYASTCITDDKLRLDAIGPLEEITPLCPGEVTRCEDAGSAIPGRQKRTYKGVITLPACANDYTFFWRRQFRNALALSNINSSSGFLNQPIYTEMKFNTTVKSCNASYSFGDNIMSRKICAGEYFRFNFKDEINNSGADSLYFELTPPLIDNAGNQVVYETGFSYTNPITTQSGFNFDNNTGILEFTSTDIPQSSIVAIKIYEYDSSGNLIGTTIRDMQIIIENCDNNAPQILGINGTQEDTIFMCGGSTTCFIIPVSDIDGDNIELLNVSNQGIPGLSISRRNNRTPNANYRFCFNPDTTGAYSFELRVNDMHCPDTLEDVRVITIIVPDDSIFQCECANVNFEYDNVCLGVATTFTGNPTFSLGNTATSWSWDFGDGATANTQSPSHTYANPGTYNVTVEFTDDAGCTKSSTSTLTICAPPNVGFYRIDSCQTPATTPNPIIFIDSTQSECSIFSRVWDYGDGQSGTSSSHVYEDSGTYTVQLVLGYGDPNAPNICYDSTSQAMYVHPRPDFRISPNDFIQSCDPTYDTLFSVTLFDTSHTIQWYLNNGLISEEDGGTNDSVIINTEGLTLNNRRTRDVQVRVEITDSLGCFNDSIRMIFDPVKPIMLNTPYCEPGDTITFWDITDTLDGISALAYGFLDRTWNFNDPNNPTATSSADTTTHYYAIEDIYESELFVIDNDSCFDFATLPLVRVVLPDSNFLVAASGDLTRDNDTICFNTQRIVFQGPNEDRATIDKYIWTFDDAGLDSVIIENNYDDTWSMIKFGNNEGSSRTTFNNTTLFHTYDSLDVGVKYVHLKMIYNTIRNDRNQLVDSLYCERNFYDTLDLRPPQQIDWLVQKNCWYDTIQLSSIHISGDQLTRWFVDWGDRGTGLDQLGNAYDTIYNEADTTVFGAQDSIYDEYQYTNFPLPDQGYRNINITIYDEFGCEQTFLIEQDYRIMKLDTQEIIPLNFCDNQTIFFPPNGGLTASGRSWNDRWNNIGTLHWDFGVPEIDSDTFLLSMVDNFEDTVTFFFPDDTIYTITLTARGNPAIGNNCISVVSQQLAIQPAPIANLGIPGISCIGSPIEFVDNSINRGLWKLDNNNQFVKVPDTLTNWILYIDGDTINMDGGTTTINGDTIDMDNFANGGTFTYTYQNSFYDTVVLVAITDTGCLSSDTIITYTAPYPIANFGCEPTLPGPRTELVFTDSTNWIEDNIEHPDSSHFWTLTNDDGDIVFSEVGFKLDEVIYSIIEEDIYFMELIVQNEFRCTDTISKEVDSYAYLDFPTAFSPTPGGDPRNDVFRLHHKGFVELLEYRIFNRYGEVVFVGGSLDDVWDGRFKGRLQQTGMYVVVVRAKDVLGREKQLRKNVLLVR